MSIKTMFSALVVVFSLFASKALAGEKFTIEKWNFLRLYTATQKEQVLQYEDTSADGSINRIFMANSPIGYLIGVEDIKKDKQGRISTSMWHFVATTKEGKMVSTLHRIVVKDSGNSVLGIENLEATDSQNLEKLEELKNELFERIRSEGVKEQQGRLAI